jgi:hypothetical protein
MPTIRDLGADGINSGSSFNVPIPSGSVAGDRMFMMIRRNYGTTDPAGWENIWAPLESGFTYTTLRTKVLDSADILLGYVTVVGANSGPTGWLVAVFEGDVSWRDPIAASFGGKSNGGDSDLNSDANVEAGDFCLLWAMNTNWSDETFTIPGSATQLLFHPDSDGVSGCLYSYVPSSDGSFATRHHNLWSGTCYQAILAFYDAVPEVPRRRRRLVVSS